jgi:large proline-rich protein BAG6
LEDVQRRFSLMSEAMHFISHAYHHLSDLSLGLTRPPPRTLGVRSLVLQPAIVQGVGIPVQAQINVVSGHIGPHPAATQQGAPQAAAGTTPSSTASSATAAAGPEDANRQQPPTSGSAPAASANPPSGPFMQDVMMGPLFEARRSSFTLPSGGNVEVVMEMTPSSLTYMPNSGGGIGGHAHGHVQEASPDLMRAIIMHAMSHQMGGHSHGGNAPASSAPSTGGTATPTPSPGMMGSSGQNSQARGSTTTNPTTSTQTRSTPRPHVHLAPVNLPGK